MCAESCGVLYVEHELLPDAFPASRIKILAMLSSQIAISIENSALYEQVRLARHWAPALCCSVMHARSYP